MTAAAARETEIDVTKHFGLVMNIAKEMQGRTSLSRDDLFQEGCIGLIRASERYDPDRGTKFTTYAGWWVRATMREAILRDHNLVRLGKNQRQRAVWHKLGRARQEIDADASHDEQLRQLAAVLEVPEQVVREMEMLLRPVHSLHAPMSPDSPTPFLEMLRAPDDTQVEDQATQEFYRDVVEGLLSELPERQASILRERFLYTGDHPTLAVLAPRYGVSRERIRQLEAKALKALGAHLGSMSETSELRYLLLGEEPKEMKMSKMSAADRRLVTQFRKRVEDSQLTYRTIKNLSGITGPTLTVLMSGEAKVMRTLTRTRIKGFLKMDLPEGPKAPTKQVVSPRKRPEAPPTPTPYELATGPVTYVYTVDVEYGEDAVKETLTYEYSQPLTPEATEGLPTLVTHTLMQMHGKATARLVRIESRQVLWVRGKETP